MIPYIIAYDLENVDSSEDYKLLWEYLETQNAQRVQKSLWFLASNLSAQELTKRLRELIGPSGLILVSELVENCWWNDALKGTQAWYNQNVPSS